MYFVVYFLKVYSLKVFLVEVNFFLFSMNLNK